MRNDTQSTHCLNVGYIMSNTISVDGVTYLRPKLFRVLTVRIGVTAVWHSHRHTCSTVRAGRFTRENKPCRRPANIPPAVREAPAFTPERMSHNIICYNDLSNEALIRLENIWNHRDILPGVNAGASRTAGGIFAGLRHGGILSL